MVEASVICPTHQQIIAYMEVQQWHWVARREQTEGAIYSRWQKDDQQDFLSTTGLPSKLRFDNDTRFVGNWLTDGYPSPLMRFLLCLGVEPDLVEPGKPYHKPFVE
ncbi:MAG: hypothetical protein H0X30_04975 [Anaerolineae bacterium]|nr:hypothetical protein [Anaerolineae bacterium]